MTFAIRRTTDLEKFRLNGRTNENDAVFRILFALFSNHENLSFSDDLSVQMICPSLSLKVATMSLLLKKYKREIVVF